MGYIQELGLNYSLAPKKRNFIGEVEFKLNKRVVKTNYLDKWNYNNFNMMDVITFYLQMTNINKIYYGIKRKKSIEEISTKSYVIKTSKDIKKYVDDINNCKWFLDLEITDEMIKSHPAFDNITHTRDICRVLESTSKCRFDLVYWIRIFEYDGYVSRIPIRIPSSNIFNIIEINKKHGNNTYKLKFDSPLGIFYSYNVSVFNFKSVSENFYKMGESSQLLYRFMNCFNKPPMIDIDDICSMMNYTGSESSFKNLVLKMFDEMKSFKLISNYKVKTFIEVEY